ncbi:oxygenase MpaB family protein [Flammeovirgaceae bacterium SG7u.111]|nr:oxygenase MpaB family protein [Flammeovirgaceae bacterium SG7u.132]WPO36870.1 oxygenase MpaB family protein [Flammeovirgaceae bacterium SG7u.111]
MSKSTYWTDSSFFDAKRLQTDPLADNAIAALVAENGKQATKDLFNKLIRQIETPIEDLPPVLTSYFEASAELPPWANTKQIARAQEMFVDYGPAMLLLLYYKSLPLLYSCKNGAEVLISTGRLAHSEINLNVFARRVAETGQFLLDVLCQGNLEPGGKGIKSIQKVRLIHASVRHFVSIKGWDEQKFGKPINQEDLGVTLMTFGIAILDGLRQFGIQLKPEEEQAYVHTWNVIGYLLGVSKSLFPNTVDEARFLLDQILERQSGASDGGKMLTKALIEFAEATIPRERLDDTPEMLIRFLVGDETANMLGVQTNAGCLSRLMPHFLKVIFKLSERLEDRNNSLEVVLNNFSFQLTIGMVNYFNNYKGANFQIPEDLKEKWIGKKD